MQSTFEVIERNYELQCIFQQICLCIVAKIVSSYFLFSVHLLLLCNAVFKKREPDTYSKTRNLMCSEFICMGCCSITFLHAVYRFLNPYYFLAYGML